MAQVATRADAGRFKRREQEQPWRAWYRTERWSRLRWAVFQRDGFKCQRKECGKVEPNTSKLVAHHTIKHKGNPSLFWDISLIKTICKPCHDSAIQSQEARGFSTSIGDDGWPTDPAHPANGGATMPRTGRMSHPSWFRRVYLPLTIVCGPPASGKSTYVMMHKGIDDLVIDLDVIKGKSIGDRLRIRNEMLGDIMRAKSASQWPAAWLIVSEPNAQWRQWWDDRLAPKQIIVIETPASVCRERAARDRQSRSAEAVAAIDKWWATYSPRQGDVRLGGTE